MRSLTAHSACTATLAAFLILSSACSDLTVRDCDLVASSGTSVGLQYSMVLPSNCPVDLGLYGEAKYTGAHVRDPNFYMYVLRLLVYNTNSVVVANNVAFYQNDIRDGYSATVEVEYPAATAGGSNVPPPAGQSIAYYDDGVFESGPSFGDYPAWGRLRITYRSAPVLASIGGADVPLSNTTATWTADASGGTSPYSYDWYRNGQYVGTGSSYTAATGSAEFGLRVEVRDQTWSTRAADFWVDVDGVRATISGPQLSYASEGGATWTVSGRGGYTPYTFHWYADDDVGGSVDLGTGTTFSGYPGQGNQQLRVVMTDSQGRTYQALKAVTGIGGGGGCDPTPPAITC